jgi:SAM-dependent methyltransferase
MNIERETMNRFGKEHVIFRTTQEKECNLLNGGIISDEEWGSPSSVSRIDQKDWQDRYEYESNLVTQIIKEHSVINILELGSGPGVLCNKVLTKNNEVNYTLVDIESAKLVNEERNFGGNFIVTDLNNGFSINLEQKMDLFIANDFLEHVQNPAKIILDIKNNMNENGLAFISVPNWRMGHAWIYRGLFDWDNFIHFMWQHGFGFVGYSGSPFRCQSSQKLDSERTMPDELVDSWNFYLLFKRNDN